MATIELGDKDKDILSELSRWFNSQQLILDGLHYKVKDYPVFDKKAEELGKSLAIGIQAGQKWRGFNLLRVFRTEAFKDDVAAYFVIPIRIGEGKPTAANHPLVIGQALRCNGSVVITPDVDILFIYSR